jgi:hypothetical protein
METFWIVGKLFLMFSLWMVPQLLGLLAYFRIRRINEVFAHLMGFIIPPLLFYYLARIIFASLFENSDLKNWMVRAPGRQSVSSYL